MNDESNTTSSTVEEQTKKRIERETEATETVKKYAIGSMAVGLIPVPLADVAALTGIQLKMLHSLSAQYEVQFSENLVKSLISSLLGGMLSLTVASLIKSVPLVGQVSGAVSMAVMGGATTYATGKVFIQHFESGGTFLDFNPEKVKGQFKNLYEEGKKFVSRQSHSTSN
ncbi:MAG: hypothetical protein BWK79_18710 [Beggiatoa sp. IS2]|nr:MAG: hypothetical protein BWK79_18710 [Beggiatoa sp. IS2]